MKNLFLSVILLLTVSFAFAANDVETVSTFDDVTVELTSSVELANADFVQSSNLTTSLEVENAVFPCCVRECILINGTWYCSEWICGDCIIIIR